MANITLGRYAPFNSFVHKLDARNKILCMILLMVAIFFQYETWIMTFAIGLALFIFTFIIMLISKVSIKSLFKSLFAMWVMVLFLLIINIFIPPVKTSTSDIEYVYDIAFKIRDFPIYWISIFQSLKIILRLLNMVAVTMVLTATTKPLDLTNGLEWYMTPLKIIKFPAHEVAMTISIALRFIPTLLDETDRIMKAQASRGIDFKHGGIKNKFRGIVALIIPLFVSAFQRSEELANAMEARGYDPRGKRTKYRELTFGYRDAIALLVVLLITTGIIITSIMNLNYFDMLNFSYFSNPDFERIMKLAYFTRQGGI